MAHYTLLSGKDTTTCTAKCDGCGKRGKEFSEVITLHQWSVTICSEHCAKQAERRLDTLIIEGSDTIRDIVSCGLAGIATFEKLRDYIRSFYYLK